MGEVEFYIYDDELWCRVDGDVVKVDERSTSIIDSMYDKMERFYPKALSALQEYYKSSSVNTRYYKYLVVRRFCKCNFGRLDTTEDDVTEGGAMRMERVPCPMRGECKHENVVCMPTFESTLSSAEERVMRLVYEGYDKEEIADRLFISANTAKVHIRNAYQRMGVHDKGEFIKYASEHNMFH